MNAEEMTEDEKEIARRMVVLHIIGESRVGIDTKVRMLIGMVFKNPDAEFWRSLWHRVDFWDVVQGMVSENLLAISGETLVRRWPEKTLSGKFLSLFRRRDDGMESFLLVLHKTSGAMEFMEDIEKSTSYVPGRGVIIEKISRICRD